MSISFIPLIAVAGFGLLIALLVQYREKWDVLGLWLMGFLGVSAVVSLIAAVLIAAPGNLWLRHTATYGWAISLIALLFLTLAYGDWGWQRAAAIGMGGWLLLLVLIDSFAGGIMAVSPMANGLVRFPQLNIGGLFFLLSWMAMAISLVILTLYSSARARLPLHANRLLYWAGALVLVFFGQLLFAVHEIKVSTPGVVLQLLGAGGLLYGVVSYHLFDVRGSARRALGYTLSTILTAAVVIIAVLAAQALAESSPDGALPTVVGLVLLLAALHQLAQQWVDKFITRFIINRGYDPAVIVETYARAIGNILDIETLSTVALGTISGVLEIRRGGVMLVMEENGAALIQPAGSMGQISGNPMSFPQDGPIFTHFTHKRQPLLQYNIDMLPEFRSLSQEQRQWLARLQIDVYVPIMTKGLPIGILAIGPKGSGELYRSDELQLLQTLAGQTVVALTNARLFDNMKKLNAEIQLLNQDLLRSNERLQYMDQVKTDFITIASHELRTPLTQIKGYTDILDAMNEGGILTPEEANNLIGRINKATNQLEQVISAMLDASQIDVDAMSLNLTEISLDTILRVAINPLAGAMRERKLTLTVRGIRDLPFVTADFQRLAQAISNLLSNAVKFTPDGGRITISANVIQDENDQDREIELVVADTGVGVDPRDQELIFEKFFRAADPQLHSTGSTKFMGAGPGLGLSLARGIIEAHGGRIWVKSDGRDPVRCPGSQFHVILPIRPPSMVAEQTSPAAALI